ncbi:MAG: tyrosine-type recombinase/integrase [Gammaproteobacteria bacterium]
MTEREQRALLKVTGEHRAGFRDHCLYAMALGTGLREHELVALSVGDVFRDCGPRRRLLLSVFKGAQRSGGTQEVLLSESPRRKLRRFHQWKARERECLDDAAPLFVSRLGRRLSLRQVRHGFTVCGKRCQVYFLPLADAKGKNRHDIQSTLSGAPTLCTDQGIQIP